MNTILYTSLVFLLSYNSPEQTAFNYFYNNIINNKYSKAQTIYFSGSTEPTDAIIGPIRECFGEEEFINFWKQKKSVTSSSIPIYYNTFSKIKKSSQRRRRKLNIKLYRTVTGPEALYTYIVVYSVPHFADHYIIKSSLDGSQVTDVCHQGETM